MNLFDVYPLFDIEIVRGKGCRVYDSHGTEYLDLYGGHAVISIGHTHPRYVQGLERQVERLGFYSNSVVNSLQAEVAEKLGALSGYEDYSLFMINSGAEANENALKLASFHTGRRKVAAFGKSFHGRTSAAVRVTDNPKIVAPLNEGFDVQFLPLNDIDAVHEALRPCDVCAVIIEGIQGVGGIQVSRVDFLQQLSEICKQTGTVLILDEIQSGYGRSGRFFAHQYAGIRPDLITVAKGMGNGFPVGGVLISPMFKPQARVWNARHHFWRQPPGLRRRVGRARHHQGRTFGGQCRRRGQLLVGRVEKDTADKGSAGTGIDDWAGV